MTSLVSLLPKLSDKGFDDDILEEGGEDAQHIKRETLKDAIQYRKSHLLPGKKWKWSTENIDRKTDEEVKKLYNIYMQQQMELKGEITDRAMGRHLINLYAKVVCKVLKIDNIDLLRRDIDEDLIIKDSMTDIGILMESTFGKWLSPVLVTSHTANHIEGFVNIWEEQPETQEKDG